VNERTTQEVDVLERVAAPEREHHACLPGESRLRVDLSIDSRGHDARIEAELAQL
jgi:hypothetical protein